MWSSACKVRWLTIGCAVVALACFSMPSLAQGQRMAVPAYFRPGPLWQKMEAAAPIVGIAIMNPASGPGDTKDADYASQVAQAQAKGLRVLGYVHTSYGKRPIADVEREAHRYAQWYHVDGIFYDEVANTSDELPYYKECFRYAKSIGSKMLVVINPGTQTVEGYMAVSDIICTFESSYHDYENSYSAPAWIAKYPAGRFWHIVLDVPSEQDMRDVVRQSKERHAGWVFITSLSTPNPYDDLPGAPYWPDELAALSGAD